MGERGPITGTIGTSGMMEARYGSKIHTMGEREELGHFCPSPSIILEWFLGNNYDQLVWGRGRSLRGPIMLPTKGIAGTMPTGTAGGEAGR